MTSARNPSKPTRLRGVVVAALFALPLLALIGIAFLTSSWVGSANASGQNGAIGEARAHLERGDGVAAEMALKRALEEGATNPQIAAWMGQAEFLQGDLVDARRWLSPGEFVNEDRAHGFQILGLVEMAEGNLPAAGWAFDRSLEANADNALLWVDIAQLRYRGGEHGGSLQAVEKALEIDADHPRALEFRGLIARESEGMVPALEWFERGLEVAPDDLSLLGEYAATLGEAGRASDMLTVARAMTKASPGNPKALYLQAVLAARGGKNSLARRILWRLKADESEIPAQLLLLGILELQAGNPAVAADSLEKLLRLQPDNRRARQLYARALLEDDAPSELIARFADAARQSDADVYLMTLVGRAYEQTGDRDKAAWYLDKAADAKRHFVTAISPVANVGSLRSEWEQDQRSVAKGIAFVRGLVASQQFGQAIAVSNKLAEFHPDSTDIAIIRGDAALAAKQFNLAMQHYTQASRIRQPSSLSVRMAAALVDSGKLREAQSLLVNSLENNGPDTEISELLTTIAVKSGNWEEAYAWLDYGIKAPGGQRDPELLRWHAEMLLRLGQDDEALPFLQRAYRLQKSNPEVAQTFSEALKRQLEASADGTVFQRKANRTLNERGRS